MISELSKNLEAVLMHLEEEFSTLQIGRASAALVEGIMVEAYGSMQAIKAIAGISIPDAKTIQIQPWDRGMLGAVEKAIKISDLNLNPVNNGLAIILNIPPLTEERRRDIVKVVNRLAEEAKISVRNARHEFQNNLKKMEHESKITEDDVNRYEKQMQEKVDEINKKIEAMAKNKEETVMKV